MQQDQEQQNDTTSESNSTPPVTFDKKYSLPCITTPSSPDNHTPNQHQQFTFPSNKRSQSVDSFFQKDNQGVNHDGNCRQYFSHQNTPLHKSKDSGFDGEASVSSAGTGGISNDDGYDADCENDSSTTLSWDPTGASYIYSDTDYNQKDFIQTKNIKKIYKKIILGTLVFISFLAPVILTVHLIAIYYKSQKIAQGPKLDTWLVVELSILALSILLLCFVISYFFSSYCHSSEQKLLAKEDAISHLASDIIRTDHDLHEQDILARAYTMIQTYRHLYEQKISETESEILHRASEIIETYRNARIESLSQINGLSKKSTDDKSSTSTSLTDVTSVSALSSYGLDRIEGYSCIEYS